MTLKRSKTFPGTQEPEMEGVYERDYGGHWRFCKFTKRHGWHCGYCASVGVAAASREEILSAFKSLPWRGLATRDGK